MSDDASKSMGGDLGAFEPGVMVPAFEQALAALPVGGRSDIVESPFGFHVIERLAVREVRVQHLVVSWAGAERAPAGVKRTRDEARALAEAARAEIVGGASWDEVVARVSDGPAREDGGELGWVGPSQLMASLEGPAFALAPGDVSAMIETPRGFHLLRRSE
jgi:peptidyl-prolyl cis-trans isomerase SurA